MKTLIRSVILGVLALVFGMSAFAAETGNREDAMNLVKKAVAYLKANGKEKAFDEINNPKGQFVDRELYIFVYDLKGTSLAIGSNQKKMVGKSLINMQDANGKYIIKEFVDVANTKGQGWIDYKWPNPVSQTIEAKSSYVEKVDDVLVGCGIYKK